MYIFFYHKYNFLIQEVRRFIPMFHFKRKLAKNRIFTYTFYYMGRSTLHSNNVIRD